MGEVIDRLHSAMNSHDLDAFVACFAPEYESDQPAHPRRAFRGSDQVRENWTNVFAGVPDFKADLLSSATTDDGVEIGEWRWQGTHVDGSPFAMQGVIVAGVQSSSNHVGPPLHGNNRTRGRRHRRDGAGDLSSAGHSMTIAGTGCGTPDSQRLGHAHAVGGDTVAVPGPG